MAVKTGKTKHNFSQSLKESKQNETDPFWTDIYKQFFHPKKVIKEEVVSDLQDQRRGADKRIHLSDGQIVICDEKFRKKDYGKNDVLLEIWSDRDKRIKGWLLKKNSITDFIAYAVLPKSLCYMIPFKKLQQLFHQKKYDWHDFAVSDWSQYGFKKIEAQNENYITTSLCISVAVLKSHIPEIRRIKSNIKPDINRYRHPYEYQSFDR